MQRDQINVRVDADFKAAVERIRRSLDPIPPRSSIVRMAIERWDEQIKSGRGANDNADGAR